MSIKLSILEEDRKGLVRKNQRLQSHTNILITHRLNMAANVQKASSFFVSLDGIDIGQSKATFYQKLQELLCELKPTLLTLPGIVELSAKSWRSQNTIVIMLSLFSLLEIMYSLDSFCNSSFVSKELTWKRIRLIGHLALHISVQYRSTIR